MPKLTDDTLLQRAIVAAIEDRKSLAAAYHNEGEHAADAMSTAAAIRALKGVKLAAMTPEQLQVVAQAFVFAEQWEQSLADSNEGSRFATESLRNVRLYREVRMRRWGRTQLEEHMANCVAVDVREFMHANTKSR